MMLNHAVLEVVRDDSDAQSYRLALEDRQALTSVKFSEGLASLLQPFRDNVAGKEQAMNLLRVKVPRIQLTDDSVSAEVLLFASGRTDAGAVQVNVTLHTQWSLVKRSPILQSISVVQYQKARLASKQKWFQDATAALFDSDQAFAEQLTAGLGDWTNRIERFAGSSIYGRHGHALADVNGDGLTDLYLCQPGGLPNRLFIQGSDGRLKDSSAASKIDWLNDTRSALFVDLDNDGDQDLVLGTFIGAFVCKNMGQGIFAGSRKR